jgi:large subunit ribosomal protein L24
MNKIRKGDQVIVLTGRDKGKRGTVSLPRRDSHLVVEGVNVVKKHVKPNPMKGTTGGIVDKTMPIHQSNVAIFNRHGQGRPRRHQDCLEDGKKVRVFKSSGEEIKA